MLIKHKKIFEYFSCFWKVFYFENFQKFQKIFNSAFWQLTCESRVFKALVASLPRMVRNSLASKTSNHEKYLEFFSKTGFLDFLATQFRDLFTSREFI